MERRDGGRSRAMRIPRTKQCDGTARRPSGWPITAHLLRREPEDDARASTSEPLLESGPFWLQSRPPHFSTDCSRFNPFPLRKREASGLNSAKNGGLASSRGALSLRSVAGGPSTFTTKTQRHQVGARVAGGRAGFASAFRRVQALKVLCVLVSWWLSSSGPMHMSAMNQQHPPRAGGLLEVRAGHEDQQTVNGQRRAGLGCRAPRRRICPVPGFGVDEGPTRYVNLVPPRLPRDPVVIVPVCHAVGGVGYAAA